MTHATELMKRVQIDFSSECWLWPEHLLTDRGYPNNIMLRMRMWRPPRLAYVVRYGAIPEGLELDHLCRVRRCYNPAHLEAVTHQVNVDRSDHWNQGSINRSKTQCPQGHLYSEDNIKWKKGGRSRDCRKCANESLRRYRERKRG